MIKHCFLFANKWSDRITELNAERLFMNILFKKVRWLNYAFTYSWVHVSSNKAFFIEL